MWRDGWSQGAGQVCGFWEQLLAVQEISIAMAPYVPAFSVLAPLEAGAIEIELALLQPLSLDFIP